MAAPTDPPARSHTPLINAGIGVAALLLGALTIGTANDDETAALRALPLVDARGLAAQAAGTAVLIEGRIAAAQPVVEARLVLLQRQHAVGVAKPGTNEFRFGWEPMPARPPSESAAPVTIDSRSSTVTLVNADFNWRDPPRIEGQPATVVAGSTRLVGFAVGDAITVRASVVDGAQARVRALEVFGGTHAAYQRSLAASAAVPTVLGVGFALVGVGMLVAALVGRRRGQRASDMR